MTMGFPTRLLDGYSHSALSVCEDSAKILVRLGAAGIRQLADDLAGRCPTARIACVSGEHFAIEHHTFRGDLTTCARFPDTALLEVRAPDLHVRNAVKELPAAVGRYVRSQTGSICWGVVASLGTLVVLRHLAPALNHDQVVQGARWRAAI
jgi:hypothetical protein